jgi:hypothetical protein
MMRSLERRLAELNHLTAPYGEASRVSDRMLDRLTAMVVLADEILGEMTMKEATPLLWAEPHVRQIYNDINVLIGRIAQ